MRSIPPEGYHPGGAHKEKVVAIENKLSQQSPYPYSRCVSQRCGPLPLNKEKAPFHPSPFFPLQGHHVQICRNAPNPPSDICTRMAKNRYTYVIVSITFFGAHAKVLFNKSQQFALIRHILMKLTK